MKEPNKPMPFEWYIGSCSESAGSFNCRQVTEYKSVYYEYVLQDQDMHLRDEVNEAVVELIKGWHSKCDDYL